jgi:CCR4-NOT transcription complex subunit 3
MSNTAIENHVNNNTSNSLSNCVSPTSTQSAALSGRTSPTSLMSPQQLQQQQILNGPAAKQQSQQVAADLSSESMSTLKTIAQEVVNRTNVNMVQTPPINMVQQQQQQQQSSQLQQQQQSFNVMDDTSTATGQNGLNANINNLIQATNMSNATNMKSSGTNEALIPPLLGVAPLGPSPLQKDHQLQVRKLICID